MVAQLSPNSLQLSISNTKDSDQTLIETTLKITKPTVLITGCSDNGIGHHLALEFAQHNYHVFATARRVSSMASLSHNPDISLIELDVISPPSILAAYTTVSDLTAGRLNILYHNAGFRSIVPAIHSSRSLASDTFEVNLFAAVEMTRVFMPMILRAGNGKIVFSNSVAAMAPIPTQGLYDASKAALGAYARVLDLEVRGLGVRVVNVITGEVGTQMGELSMEKLPEDSPYSPIKDVIDQVWSVRKTVMPVEVYAKRVVDKIVLKNPPREIWLGGNANLVWLLEMLGMQWFYGLMFGKEYGLDRLRPAVY